MNVTKRRIRCSIHVFEYAIVRKWAKIVHVTRKLGSQHHCKTHRIIMHTQYFRHQLTVSTLSHLNATVCAGRLLSFAVRSLRVYVHDAFYFHSCLLFYSMLMVAVAIFTFGRKIVLRSNCLFSCDSPRSALGDISSRRDIIGNFHFFSSS